MKKLLLIFVLIFMMIAVSGCNKERYYYHADDVVFENFIVVKKLGVGEEADSTIYEVYNKDTHVMYYLIKTFGAKNEGITLCPMYGVDGKVAIYAWSNPN